MRTVLVTGGAGFIGRQCLEILRKDPSIEVHAICRDRDLDGRRRNNVTWHAVDLLDAGAVDIAVSIIRPATVLHLAWCSKHGELWNSSENLAWLGASLHLARAFARSGGERFVTVGTCAEYNGSGTFAENDSSTPLNLYGTTKRAARQNLQRFCAASRLGFAWPILFHMYGPHENPFRLVAAAILSLARGEEFHCSDGLQRRDFLHVADVGDILVRILMSDVQGPINVGSGRIVSLREVLAQVAEVVGRPNLIRFGSIDRALNDPDFIIPDLTRQNAEIGWTPRFRLAEGMRDTVEWWMKMRRTGAAA